MELFTCDKCARVSAAPMKIRAFAVIRNSQIAASDYTEIARAARRPFKRSREWLHFVEPFFSRRPRRPRIKSGNENAGFVGDFANALANTETTIRGRVASY